MIIRILNRLKKRVGDMGETMQTEIRNKKARANKQIQERQSI